MLHAESLLTSSGTLVVDGKAIISAEDASAYTLDLLQLTVNPATTGTFAGDALQITMDATDANGYTGDGLKFIVDQSQINGPGRIIAIDDDAGAEIFAINKYGFVKTERGYVSYDGFMGEDFNDERDLSQRTPRRAATTRTGCSTRGRRPPAPTSSRRAL